MTSVTTRFIFLLLLSLWQYAPVSADTFQTAICRGHRLSFSVAAIKGTLPSDTPTPLPVCVDDILPKLNHTFTCITPQNASFNLALPARCGTQDNGDYYGFGVRVGFYFTWFGAFVASQFAPAEIPGALDGNSIFLFALAISIAKGTFHDHNLARVDVLVMLLVGIGTTIGTMSLWGYRTCLYRQHGRSALKYFGGSGTNLRLLLCFCVNLYWLWFWLSPSHRGLGVPNCDPRCQTVWIFGYPVSGGIRWFPIIFGLLYAIYWGVMLPGPLLSAVIRGKKILDNIRSGDLSRTSKLRYKTGLAYTGFHRANLILATLNFLWLCFVIALIEVTLHQNGARNLFITSQQTGTPSQLIPLLIGLITFARMLYVAWENLRYGDDGIDPSMSEEEELKEQNKETGTGRYTAPDHWWRWLCVQAPNFKAAKDEDERSKGDSARFENVPMWKRALVTWLPWLGLLGEFPGEQSLASFLREKDGKEVMEGSRSRSTDLQLSGA